MEVAEYPTVRNFRSKKDFERAITILGKTKFRIAKVDYEIRSIRNLKPAIPLTYFGESLLALVGTGDYEEVDWVSDWYNHLERAKARRVDEKESPFEWWSKNSGKYLHLTPKEQEKVIYSHVRGCGNFRASIYAGLIDYFDAKRVLDPCAGWGCRLIASLAKNVEEYRGFDPNDHLDYQSIMDDLCWHTKASVEYMKFEDTKLPKDHFDLVATCPPYLDLEIYAEGPFEDGNHNYQSWFDGFLLTLLKKSRDAVKPSGRIVIIVGDLPARLNRPSLVKGLLEKAKEARLHFDGVIAFDQNDPQGMWIFGKTQ